MLIEPDADVAHHVLPEPAGKVGVQVLHNGVEHQQHRQEDKHAVKPHPVVFHYMVVDGVLD